MLESDSRRVICIHPGSKGISERRWPEEYWARIIDAVVQKYRCRVVMIGNENERELSKRIQKECGGQATNLAGKCTIGQTAAIIQGSDILLCGASGPLHMAVALAVSAVYIGGGVDLRRWGAYGNSPMHRAVLRDSNCRPENCHSCPDRWERCVRSITPDAVLAAVSQAMEGLTSRKQGSP
jgi:ADP-heptose:LPS heptosyltransferase